MDASDEAQRALRRARAATGIFFFANGATVGSWVPQIPMRAHALGLNPGQLGTVLLGGGLGAVMAMPLAGKLTPRYGSRLISTMGGAGFAGALSLAILAPSRWWLFAALVCFGVCGAGMDVAMNAQAVLAEAKTRRPVLSWLHGVYSLGNVVGSLGGSAALARHVAPQRLAFGVSIALMFAVLGASRFLLAGDARRPGEPTHPSLQPRLVLLGVLVVAAMVSEGASVDWSGVYLRSVRGLGPGWAGVGFGVFSGLMLVGRLLGDRIVQRLGQVWTLRLGGLIGACGSLLVVFGPGTATVLLGFALLGWGLANASPILYRTAGQMAGVPAGVGLATAVGMGYAGLLAGPPTLGGVAQAFGLPAIFLVMTALCLGLSAAAPISGSAKT